MPPERNLNPQGEQMADESMVRNLAAQIEAIWPQERELLRRYGLPEDVAILDAGCGTGEASARLLEAYPRAALLGVDILEPHLERARERCARFGARARFERRSVFDLGLPDRAYDLVVCRHVLQAIPHPERVLAELVRRVRPGGRLHLVAEDYGMLQFPGDDGHDPDAFWHEGPPSFGRSTGTDLRVGRNAYGHLRALGLRAIAVDYVVVDTLRVPRETFAAILTAWRDGYVDAIAEHTRFTPGEVRALFDGMIATIRDPDRYAVWHVPVVSAVVP